MLKNIVVLEINGKKDVLGHVEVETPSEFMFASETEQILNCHIFEDFIDRIFTLTTEEFMHEFDKKIDNVYITFIDEDDAFVCSVVIDKFNLKKQTYRIRFTDWQSTGHTFKYVDSEDGDFNNDLKPEF